MKAVKMLAEKEISKSGGWLQAFTVNGEVFATWGLGLDDGQSIEMDMIWEHPYHVQEFASEEESVAYVNNYGE